MLLKSLYQRLTDVVKQIDTPHIEAQVIREQSKRIYSMHQSPSSLRDLIHMANKKEQIVNIKRKDIMPTLLSSYQR